MYKKIFKIFTLILSMNPISLALADNIIPSGNAYGSGSSYVGNTDPTSSNNSTSSQNVSLSNSQMQDTGSPQIYGTDNGNMSNVNSNNPNQYNPNNGNLNNNNPNYLNQYTGNPNNKNISSNSQMTKPDEFAQSVAIRTGLILNRFGYNLFNTPNTFFASDNTPASSNYILGPGDQVSIRGWGAVDINYQAVIDKEGGVVIPKVGRVSLVGVSVSNLDSYLKAQIGKNFRNFSVSATVTKLRSIQITVAGFANTPGTYTVSSLSTLTDAVFASGGPSSQGSLRNIELKRNGQVIVNYDMYDLLLNGDNKSDIRLAPGDIVYIKPYGSQIAIYDGVKVPGIYEARDGETVSDIVKFAGGYTFNNTKDQVIIEKMTDSKQIDVASLDFNKGLNQVIANGEIIHFFRMPDRYHDAIVLIGNIANPSRYNWHEGIKIRDIIPNKDSLLTKSFWNSYNYNSYGRDMQLGLNGMEKTLDNSSNNQSAQSYSSGLNNTTESGQKQVFNYSSNLFMAGPIAIPEANINWNYAVVIRLNPDTYKTELIPFNLSKALQGDKDNNIALKPGDIINILSSKDIINPIQSQMINVLIDGEVNDPGIYQVKSGATLADVIEEAGGITSDAYLYGMEFNRDSVKKQQTAALNQMLDSVQQSLLSQASNSATQVSATTGTSSGVSQAVLASQQAFIDKLRQLKPTGRVVLGLDPTKTALKDLPKLTIENGDAIHIPPRNNTIGVLGQVYNPATFIYDPKRSVQDYIDIAGTPNDFADTSSIYVLHADGTLYNKQQAGWFGSFYGKRLYPGDSIVVPQEIQFMSLQQNLINWTQILANFGLGAAAINQLK